MKRSDPKLYRPKDHRVKGVRRPERVRPERANRGPDRPKAAPVGPERPKAPPAPWFLGGAVAFSALFMLSVYLGYELGPFYHIPDLVMIASVLVLLFTVYKCIDFCQCHWEAHRHRCRVSVTVLAVVISMGLVLSAYIFVVGEPYHDWEYEAELSCTTGCRVWLPAPMTGHEGAFFTNEDIEVDGTGNARVIEVRYEHEVGSAVEVQWSGNVSLRVSRDRDYRHLAMERYGLWNSTEHRFVVVGHELPGDADVNFSLGFRHRHVTWDLEEVTWSISGTIGPNENRFAPVSG